MELTMRGAGRADLDAVIRIRGGAPSDEMLGMAGGDARRACALRDGLLRIFWDEDTIARTTFALRDGEAFGLPQAGGEMGAAISPRLVVLAVRVFGPLGALRLLSRENARRRVSFHTPSGTYHVAELHVDERWRGQGIGAAMLAHGERAARQGGYDRMSLTTTLSNPARRLYERTGFGTVETRTDPEYERITGIPGRVLMVKELR
jgi:ribosomal protein S18 acetylase RimI-like enzyme